MNRENIVMIVVAIVAGFLAGYLIFSLGMKKDTNVLPSGGGNPTDYQARIAAAEKIVAQDPKNVQAWIQLGNDYYDTEQPQKAISAYGKALELQPDNANVLTDQGVMYRRVGWFDKALANFERAQKADPKHMQSLYNIGIVYAEDLKQPDKAIAAWNRFLAIDSTSPTAQQIRRMVDGLKAGQTMPPMK